MNGHPPVPLGLDVQLRGSDVRLVVAALYTSGCVRCHRADLVTSASVRNFFFFFFFFFFF
jgi:hypothetical protein